MTTPHKHAEIIKAWADGAEIEGRQEGTQVWLLRNSPGWNLDWEYRIKPAAPMVETNYSTEELYQISTNGNLKTGLALKNVANAAIARAIADGQVVSRDAYERAIEKLHIHMYKADKEGMTFDDGGYRFAVTGDPASINSLMRFCGENSESKRASRDMAVAKAVASHCRRILGAEVDSSVIAILLGIDLAAIIAGVKL